MTNQTGKIVWGQVAVSVLGTAVFSFIVGVLLFHYTSKSPDLVYETYPPAHFTKHAVQISIYNGKVENVGNDLAEDVQVYLELPSSANIQDLRVEPSLSTIKYETNRAELPNAREVSFPRLNQGESVRFSILVDKGEAANLQMEVRGRGVTGHTDREEQPAWIYIVLGGFAGVMLFHVWSLIVRVLHLGDEARSKDLYISQKKIFDEELRLIRTKETTPQEQLQDLILHTKFRLFFDPASPGLSKTKTMRFGNEGAILEGKNNNESSWRIRGGLLELLDAQGNVHSRFYYSPQNQAFYHTNDPDTGSIQKHGIRDQYMVPE